MGRVYGGFGVVEGFGRIDSSALVGSTSSNGILTPTAVKMQCGHCHVFVQFICKAYTPNVPVKLITFQGQCPACNQTSAFVVRSKSERSYSGDFIVEALVSPIPATVEQRRFKAQSLAPRIQKTIENGYRALAQQDNEAALNAARRALEGMCKSVLSDNEKTGQNLHGLVQAAVEKIEYSEPMKKFAHSCRKAGNLGSHFDEETEPTKEQSLRTLELVEAIGYYCFEMPIVLDDIRSELEDSTKLAEFADGAAE